MANSSLTLPSPPPSRPLCSSLLSYEADRHNTGDQWLAGASASASCCDQVLDDWNWGSLWFFKSQTSDFYETSTSSVWHTTEFFVGRCSGPFTTLCDGIPRALCSPSPAPTVVLTSGLEFKSISSLVHSSAILPYPYTRPNCSIDASHCTRLWDDWYQIRKSFYLGSRSFSSLQETSTSVTALHPSCLNDELWSCYEECSFNIDLTLIYWPAEPRENSLCNKAAPTPAISASSPMRTTQWGRHTLTSPTVYVYYSTMTHQLGCGGQHKDVVVPLNPKDVFIQKRVTHETGPEITTIPLNFGDLGYSTVGRMSYPLVPYSLYTDQMKCSKREEECKTIYHDYEPVIVFRMDPAFLRNIDPAWKGCGFELHNAYDPPLALTPAKTLDMPTQTADLRPDPVEALPAVTNPAEALPMETGLSLPILAPQHIPLKTTVFSTATAVPPTGRPLRGHVAHSVHGNILNELDGYRLGAPQGKDSSNDAPPVSSVNNPSIRLQTQGVLQAELTISGKPFTALQISSGVFSIAGQTLSSGGNVATIDGAAISVSGSGVVVEYPSATSSPACSTCSATDVVKKGSKHKNGAPGVTIRWAGKWTFALVLLYLMCVS